MKKFPTLIVFSVILSCALLSCSSKFKKSGIEQALGLEAKVYEFEAAVYDKALNGTETAKLNKGDYVKFLEFSKGKNGKPVARVMFEKEGNKAEGWCEVKSLQLNKDDYEKIASDCLMGLDYVYELLGPDKSEKIANLGDCSKLFSNMIEITHEKKSDVTKLIKALNRVKYCAAQWCSYDDDLIDSPVYLAAKYNYYQLFTDCFTCNYDDVYQPEGLTIPACAVKNNSNDVLVSLLLCNYIDGNVDAGNGQTLYELACSVNNNKAKEMLSASLDEKDYIDAVKAILNIKEEPKDKKYEWNVCKAMEDESFTKDSFDAYIKADANTKINMRKEPDVNSEKTGIVYNNSIVKVYRISDNKTVIDGTASNWLYIKSSENIEGWVFGDYVYVERNEKPSVEKNEDITYYFNYYDRVNFIRTDKKIVYQNLEDDILKSDEKIFILGSFDINEYNFIEDGCMFEYLLVRTKEGKVGVISSKDVANVWYQTEQYDEKNYCNVVKSKINITMMEPGGEKQKIYKLNFVDGNGKSEELFLPGSRVYENGIQDIQIKYYSDSKSKKEYPLIAITEHGYVNDIGYVVQNKMLHLYTVKDARMYIFAETEVYGYDESDEIDDDNFEKKFYDFKTNTIFHYKIPTESSDEICESWTYGPLDSDPQIFVLKEYNPNAELPEDY